MITGNPLSPEFKHAIDTIKNNPNTSPEQKQEEFGLLMAGMKEKLGYLSENSSDSNILDAGGLGGMPDSVQMPPTGQDQSSGLGGMLRNVPFVGSGIRAAENLTGMIPKDVAANPFIKQILPNGMVQKDNDGNFQLTMEKKMPPPPPTPSIPQAMQGQMQQTPMQNIQPRPVPPQSAQIEGLLKHPSRWDMIKEKMFAGEDQQGLFGKAGANRGSMGLGGYFNDLFNDPARMAMLSGGLTAMDQNSYYDKEGFQSPWTGLRSGLGGAQAGYKSVIDRRKAEADTALAKAKTTAEGQSSQKFKSAQIGDATFMYSDADIQRRRNELMAGGKMGWREATNQAIKETGTRIEKGIAPKSIYEIKQAYTKGEGQLAQIDILEGYAQDALNSGFVGMGKRGWDSIQGALSINTDTTESTKLINGINKLISQNWQSLVGGGQLSEADQIFIDKVIKSPKSVFTTSSEIRKSLSDLKRILRETQGRRAETIGIEDYNPSKRLSPNLSGGGSADDLINEFK
jgi:hypothetical protein